MRLFTNIKPEKENGYKQRLTKNKEDFNIPLDNKYYNNTYLDDQIKLLRVEIAYCQGRSKKIIVSEKMSFKRKKFEALQGYMQKIAQYLSYWHKFLMKVMRRRDPESLKITTFFDANTVKNKSFTLIKHERNKVLQSQYKTNQTISINEQNKPQSMQYHNQAGMVNLTKKITPSKYNNILPVSFGTESRSQLQPPQDPLLRNVYKYTSCEIIDTETSDSELSVRDKGINLNFFVNEYFYYLMKSLLLFANFHYKYANIRIAEKYMALACNIAEEKLDVCAYPDIFNICFQAYLRYGVFLLETNRTKAAYEKFEKCLPLLLLEISFRNNRSLTSGIQKKNDYKLYNTYKLSIMLMINMSQINEQYYSFAKAIECCNIGKWIAVTNISQSDSVLKYILRHKYTISTKYLSYVQELNEFERVLKTTSQLGKIFNDDKLDKHEEITCQQFNKNTMLDHYFNILGKKYKEAGYEIKNSSLKYLSDAKTLFTLQESERILRNFIYKRDIKIGFNMTSKVYDLPRKKSENDDQSYNKYEDVNYLYQQAKRGRLGVDRNKTSFEEENAQVYDELLEDLLEDKQFLDNIESIKTEELETDILPLQQIKTNMKETGFLTITSSINHAKSPKSIRKSARNIENSLKAQTYSNKNVNISNEVSIISEAPMEEELDEEFSKLKENYITNINSSRRRDTDGIVIKKSKRNISNEYKLSNYDLVRRNSSRKNSIRNKVRYSSSYDQAHADQEPTKTKKHRNQLNEPVENNLKSITYNAYFDSLAETITKKEAKKKDLKKKDLDKDVFWNLIKKRRDMFCPTVEEDQGLNADYVTYVNEYEMNEQINNLKKEDPCQIDKYFASKISQLCDKDNDHFKKLDELRREFFVEKQNFERDFQEFGKARKGLRISGIRDYRKINLEGGDENLNSSLVHLRMMHSYVKNTCEDEIHQNLDKENAENKKKRDESRKKEILQNMQINLTKKKNLLNPSKNEKVHIRSRSVGLRQSSADLTKKKLLSYKKISVSKESSMRKRPKPNLCGIISKHKSTFNIPNVIYHNRKMKEKNNDDDNDFAIQKETLKEASDSSDGHNTEVDKLYKFKKAAGTALAELIFGGGKAKGKNLVKESRGGPIRKSLQPEISDEDDKKGIKYSTREIDVKKNTGLTNKNNNSQEEFGSLQQSENLSLNSPMKAKKEKLQMESQERDMKDMQKTFDIQNLAKNNKCNTKNELNKSADAKSIDVIRKLRINNKPYLQLDSKNLWDVDNATKINRSHAATPTEKLRIPGLSLDIKDSKNKPTGPKDEKNNLSPLKDKKSNLFSKLLKIDESSEQSVQFNLFNHITGTKNRTKKEIIPEKEDDQSTFNGEKLKYGRLFGDQNLSQDQKKQQFIHTHMKVRDLIQMGMDSLEESINKADQKTKDLKLSQIGGKDRMKSLFYSVKKNKKGAINMSPRKKIEDTVYTKTIGSGNEGFSINSNYYENKRKVLAKKEEEKIRKKKLADEKTTTTGSYHKDGYFKDMTCNTTNNNEFIINLAKVDHEVSSHNHLLEGTKDLAQSVKGYSMYLSNRGKLSNFSDVFQAAFSKRQNFFSSVSRKSRHDSSIERIVKQSI